MIHKLKTINPYFDALWCGCKTFEVRKNDRNFHEYDQLVLKEYVVEGAFYTGREVHARVSYVLHGGCFGIQHGHVVMALSEIKNEDGFNGS